MRQNINQNIDLPQINPLLPPPLKKNFHLKIPKNPKIIILVVLAIIVLLLLIASLFVRPALHPSSQVKNLPTTTNLDSSTTPTPGQFTNQLNKIEILLQSAPIDDPPQLDTNIKIIY